MKYVLALDQGTTSSRAIVFDRNGQIVGSAQQEFKQVYPHTGWVEHEPQEILGSQVGVIPEALVRAGVSSQDIVAIGITNQRETTIVWDKNTGKPVYNAIVWQCRRTMDYCEQLRQQGLDKLIYDKTGLVLDAYFSATKIKWILDNVEGARERAERGELLFGTVDTYLMWNLSKGRIFATDYTNASRTMLYNIHTLSWDDDLLKLFDIPRCMLPEVRPSGYNYGNADSTVVGANIPICGVVGDQQSALFGQLCVERGSMKNTYGTGCFLLMNTGDKPVRSNGLVTTLAASLTDKPDYVLEGSVFMGGAIVQYASLPKRNATRFPSRTPTACTSFPLLWAWARPIGIPKCAERFTDLRAAQKRNILSEPLWNPSPTRCTTWRKLWKRPSAVPSRRSTWTAAQAQTTFCCNFRQTYSKRTLFVPRSSRRPLSALAILRGSLSAIGRTLRTSNSTRRSNGCSNPLWMRKNAPSLLKVGLCA